MEKVAWEVQEMVVNIEALSLDRIVAASSGFPPYQRGDPRVPSEHDASDSLANASDSDWGSQCVESADSHTNMTS